MTKALLDRLAICEGIQNWALWRDAGDWERLATVWHDDGYMVATWFQSPATDFIARSRAASANGLRVLHVLGGTTVDLADRRAVSQTRMEIIQRASVHDVLVDVHCHGRFYDAWEERRGRWGLVHRNVVYELDQMAPVDPASRVTLDQALLSRFPDGYRHLAYLQTQSGMEVNPDLPGTVGAAIEALRARMQQWQDGGSALDLR